MRITILSIGDELIDGRLVDSNSAVISARLLEHGMRVQRHVTVADSEPDIIEALTEAARNSDAVIVTGGLGPTADDLTAAAAAKATGRRLLVNEEAKRHAREMSGKLTNLIMCPLSDKQAMVPAKAGLINNPTGTACGFQLMHNGCHMFFLPGVPSEMTLMLDASVLPYLLERTTRKRVIRTEHFNVFGPCEAEVDRLLEGIARPAHGLQLGICVSFPAMRVSLKAEEDCERMADALLQQAVDMVNDRLDDFIYSTGEITMDEALADMFRRQPLTLALAESCTGGMISQRITSVSGSSAWFLEGSVTYSNDAKVRRLEVDAALLAEKGAVSREVATAMARGVRIAAGSDLGLAVTGIAGPEGGSEEKPVGTVFISLAAPDGCWTKRYSFGGSREEVRIMTAWTAMDWLRRYLKGQRQAPCGIKTCG